jgi:hypothetical protein
MTAEKNGKKKGSRTVLDSACARGRNPGTLSTTEDYGDGTSMVLGEGEKPSGEEVSFSLCTSTQKGTKDRPTNFLIGLDSASGYFHDSLAFQIENDEVKYPCASCMRPVVDPCLVCRRHR